MNHLPGGDGVFVRWPYLRYLHQVAALWACDGLFGGIMSSEDDNIIREKYETQTAKSNVNEDNMGQMWILLWCRYYK
jgi:hypothetical protein